MFTRKQVWRRTTTKKIKSNQINSNFIDSIPLSRSTSDPTGCSLNNNNNNNNFNSINLKERPKSTNNLMSEIEKEVEEKKEENKKVRFSDTSRVILVPCLNEYRSHGLHNELWWENNDYCSFKHSASVEFYEMLSKFEGDVKEVLKRLYQHNHENNEESKDNNQNNQNNNKDNENNNISSSPLSISSDLESIR
mmetsp:Transcript_4719/g.4765  ORF Transcript_4719/g.4765 Transcript_4719/m.4765 type:complete len:193 (+) Transcript_4719:64-642(+)